MKKDFRLTLAAIIWPGPIDGPLPLTLFKIITPLLILTIGVVPATIFMGTVAALFVLFFFDTIWLEGSFNKVNEWVDRLPRSFQKALRVGTITALLPLVLSVGPFPLALAFRFLEFKGFRAQAILVLGCYVNSLIWTGVIWGGGITILKNLLENNIF